MTPRRGRQLVAAIELVSPSNKDRSDARELFVGKVAALLQQSVCYLPTGRLGFQWQNCLRRSSARFRQRGAAHFASCQFQTVKAFSDLTYNLLSATAR